MLSAKIPIFAFVKKIFITHKINHYAYEKNYSICHAIRTA